MSPGDGADRSRRGGRWRTPRLWGLAVAVSAVVLSSSVSAVPERRATTFVVLQMNLCNSGAAKAKCYAFGKAVDEAVGKIRRYPPELVTLQEICYDDLYARTGWGKLAQAMADRYGNGHVAVDFAPALNRDTDDWYRCVNGAPFGLAVMHHYPGGEAHHGWYASQDSSEEIRAWLCTTVIPGRLTGCTTHLSTDPPVAVRQCHELMSILAAPWVLPQVIVTGDVNLRSAPGRPDCTLANFQVRSDNDLQRVFFTSNIGWIGGRSENMRWTDHPLLYEKLRI